MWVYRCQDHVDISSSSPCKANTFTCCAVLCAQVCSRETKKPDSSCKREAAEGQLLCKQVSRDFPCKACTLHTALFHIFSVQVLPVRKTMRT